MQTQFAAAFRDTPAGQEADAILRKCVHCGFCTATCPTYQLLGDELDGPRGRIYLIKEVLEGAQPTRQTQLHLDRCLTCRACETTCPSGVPYARLLDIGRHQVETMVPRSFRERFVRRLLLATVPWRTRFGTLLTLGRLARPFTFGKLKRAIPTATDAGHWPAERHARRMLVLQGCVQPAAAPNINAAAARVMARLGVSLIRVNDGCCGAVAHHLSEPEQARNQTRRNIDAWWPAIEQGAEAVVVTASGCGSMIREYGHLLKDDPKYAAKASHISSLFKDISQVVARECQNAQLVFDASAEKKTPLAFHSPCSLQHGLQIRGTIESLLEQAGFALVPVGDSHLCCGSAGTYSLLQPDLSQQLKQNKLKALQAHAPEVIATANIGCLLQLASGTDRPVRHWIELIDARLQGKA